MKNRTNRFVSVILLIVYGTLTFVAVPLHVHDDSLFATGSGTHKIVQHDDALHCKHHSIEVHVDCTICSFASHSALNKVVGFIPELKLHSTEHISTFFFSAIKEIHSSHSRRGPPVLFG